MNHSMQIFRRMRYWQGLSALLLMAFLLRAAVAVGYMPAYAPGQTGPISITLCVTGLSDGAVKVLGLEHADHQASSIYTDSCVFSPAFSLLGLTFAPPWAGLSFTPLLVAYGSRVARADIAALVCGPPLGSRAPPC